MQPVRKIDVFWDVQASIWKMNVANVHVRKRGRFGDEEKHFKAKLCNHLYYEDRCFCVGCKTRALWVWFHYNRDINWEHGQHILFGGKMHRACMFSKRERDRNTIIPVITCWVDCKRMSCWKNPLVVASRFPGNTNGVFLLEPGNSHNHFVCLS